MIETRHKVRHCMTKSRLRDLYFGAWTLPCPLAWCLPFEIASPVNSPPPTRRPSVVASLVYSGDPPTRRRHDSGASFDSIVPDLFPLRPAFSHEGTGFSIASRRPHSRTHSIEFLVAHERSSKAVFQTPPMLPVQIESSQLFFFFFWSILCCDGRF